jgi:hypothetical protein
VDSIVSISGHLYAQMSHFVSLNGRIIDSCANFFRYGDDGEILTTVDFKGIDPQQRSDFRDYPSSGISTWYNTNAEIDESWNAFGPDIGCVELAKYRISLESRSDTVITQDQMYIGCLRFFINKIGASDTDYYVWLARGVGLVKFHNPSGVVSPCLLTNFHISADGNPTERKFK